MKTGYTKKALVTILAGLIFASVILAPSAKALTFNFTDASSVDLTVSTSSNVIESGDMVTFTVTLTLNTFLNGNAHARIWLNNSAQVAVNLVNQDLMTSKNWSAGTSFNLPYTVVIPTNVANNNYVYATIDVGTKHFSNLVIALVQSPTYFELQTQIIQLQGNVTSLAAQVNSLQTQFDVATANSSSLQNQLTILNSTYKTLLANYNSLVSNSTSDKSALLSQISVMEGELSSLNSTNAALQSQLNQAQTNSTSLSSQVAVLQGNNSALKTQVNSLQADKDSLLNQTAVLQNQVNRLQFNSTNLQTMVDNLSNQTSTLHLQVSDLQSKNSTTSILMYLATFVAVAFIVATAYIIFIVIKRKGKDTEGTPLY
jgi:peptidoglycan hydrolase CwlO-like protein